MLHRPSTVRLTCPDYPRYTFSLTKRQEDILTLEVGVRRGEDPLLLIQLAVGEELQLSKGLLCQITRVHFAYTGRRATVQARCIAQIV